MKDEWCPWLDLVQSRAQRLAAQICLNSAFVGTCKNFEKSNAKSVQGSAICARNDEVIVKREEGASLKGVADGVLDIGWRQYAHGFGLDS